MGGVSDRSFVGMTFLNIGFVWRNRVDSICRSSLKLGRLCKGLIERGISLYKLLFCNQIRVRKWVMSY